MMRLRKAGYWREMYAAAKKGNVGFLQLKAVAIENQMLLSTNAEARQACYIALNQLKRLINLAILKKREQEEELALAFHRKQWREATVYSSRLSMWQLAPAAA
jgi:hypothetical protein